MAKRSFMDYISQGMEMGLRYQQMADEKKRRKEELEYRKQRDEKDDTYRETMRQYQVNRDTIADERYSKEFGLRQKEFDSNQLARDVQIASVKQNLLKGYRTKSQAEAMGYQAGGYQSDTDIEGKVGLDFLPEGEYISNDILDDWYKKRQLDITQQNNAINAGTLNLQRQMQTLLIQEKIKDMQLKDAMTNAANKSNTELPKLQQLPIAQWGASGDYLKEPEGVGILSNLMSLKPWSETTDKQKWNAAKKTNTDKAAEYIDKYVSPILNMREERLKLGLGTNDLDVVISNIQPALYGIYTSFDKGYSYSKSGNRRVKADVYNTLRAIEAITQTNSQQASAAVHTLMQEEAAKAKGRAIGQGREH
jgi:hypothetical protein